jgi:hypothetical protein
MNRLFVLLALLFVSDVFANECPTRYTIKAEHMLVNDDLGSIDTTGKLEKFTDHDYSISCNIKINNRNFKWFTDEIDTRFLLQESIENGVVYYGFFRLKNT